MYVVRKASVHKLVFLDFLRVISHFPVYDCAVAGSLPCSAGFLLNKTVVHNLIQSMLSQMCIRKVMNAISNAGTHVYQQIPSSYITNALVNPAPGVVKENFNEAIRS